MRSLRDPAPSRWAYRVNRWMLTPGVRIFLRAGLPLLVTFTVTALYLADEGRRTALTDMVAEARRHVEERPEFMVHMMGLDGAGAAVDAEVRARLPFDFPLSSFDIDLAQVQKTVEELDAVASASVQIRSGVLEVAVEERQPVVIWRSEAGIVLLDETGHRVAPLVSRSERSDLPLIVGHGAGAAVDEALELFDAAQPVAARLRGLVRVGERRWDVALDRDQRILLPEADPVTALKKVVALDAAQDLLARDLTAIDFRNPDRPVLRLSQTALDARFVTSGPVTR